MDNIPKQDLSQILRSGKELSFLAQVKMVIVLSIPSILAQLSSIVMQYIDASMVGRLGAASSASIGLVSSTTWLFWGIGSSLVMGFSVQVAHLVGAGRDNDAKVLVGKSITTISVVSIVLLLVGLIISPYLPIWLGGSNEIQAESSIYFKIFSLSLPCFFLNYLASGMLKCSGNMALPGALNVITCVLDVIFNWLFIFPTHYFSFGMINVAIPGANLGVAGAALGTLCAEAICAIFLLWYMVTKSPHLKLVNAHHTFLPDLKCLKKALRISLPMGTEHVVICVAQILLTVIVAPLGTVAIAANAFAITAESLCYMPGYGVSDAATTIVGQCLGAGRKELTKKFAGITVMLGVLIMTIMGFLMYISAPALMAIFTPDELVQTYGANSLRIEAWAEPMFAASIVCYGVFVGAGDTLIPAIMNLGSMWVVRITLAAVLAPIMGLYGVWLAMCIELSFRGAIFIYRLLKGSWLNHIDRILDKV